MSITDETNTPQKAKLRLLAPDHRRFGRRKVFRVTVPPEHRNNTSWAVEQICNLTRHSYRPTDDVRFSVTFEDATSKNKPKRTRKAVVAEKAGEAVTSIPEIECKLCQGMTPDHERCTVCGANPLTCEIVK